MRVEIPRPLFNLLAVGLAVFVVVFVIMAVRGSKKIKEDRADRERYEERRKLAMDKVAAARALDDKASAACFARARAAFAKIVPDPLAVPEQKPADLSSIAYGRYVGLEEGAIQRLVVSGGFFADGLGLGCKLPPYLHQSAKPGEEGFEEDIKAADARIAELEAMPLPDATVTSVYACTAEACKGALVWVSLQQQKVLAAIQVSIKPVDRGGDKDRAALAKLAMAKSDKWFQEWAVKK